MSEKTASDKTGAFNKKRFYSFGKGLFFNDFIVEFGCDDLHGDIVAYEKTSKPLSQEFKKMDAQNGVCFRICVKPQPVFIHCI